MSLRKWISEIRNAIFITHWCRLWTLTLKCNDCASPKLENFLCTILTLFVWLQFLKSNTAAGICLAYVCAPVVVVPVHISLVLWRASSTVMLLHVTYIMFAHNWSLSDPYLQCTFRCIALRCLDACRALAVKLFSCAQRVGFPIPLIIRLWVAGVAVILLNLHSEHRCAQAFVSFNIYVIPWFARAMTTLAPLRWIMVKCPWCFCCCFLFAIYVEMPSTPLFDCMLCAGGRSIIAHTLSLCWIRMCSPYRFSNVTVIVVQSSFEAWLRVNGFVSVRTCCLLQITKTKRRSCVLGWHMAARTWLGFVFVHICYLRLVQSPSLSYCTRSVRWTHSCAQMDVFVQSA